MTTRWGADLRVRHRQAAAGLHRRNAYVTDENVVEAAKVALQEKTMLTVGPERYRACGQRIVKEPHAGAALACLMLLHPYHA